MGTTQRYLMFFSYIGTAFRGSQLQHNNNVVAVETVQYILEKGLKTVFKVDEDRPFCVYLASRTDTGVHALRAALSVDLPKYKNSHFLHPIKLKHQLNSYFVGFRDIRISEIYKVPDTFQLYKSCLDKTYMYRFAILKHEFSDECPKNLAPIVEIGRTELIRNKREFDFKKVEEVAPLFEGQKDFGAILGKPTKNTRPTICNIMLYTAEKGKPFMPIDPIAQKYDFYHITTKGDRFLYHMVRRMVSLTVGIGFNIITQADIKKLFEEPVPSSWPRNCSPSMSGKGLYLVNVNIDIPQMNEDHLAGNASEEVDS